MNQDLDDTHIWINAVQSGFLHVISELHYNNYPGYTTDVMDYAAMIGNIDIVLFLFINRLEGCSDKAIYWASTYGHIEIVQFLYLHFPYKCNIQECINIAKFNNYLNIVDFLEQQLYIRYNIDNIKVKAIKHKKCVKKNKNKNNNNSTKVFNCDKCKVLITQENSSRVKIRCKACEHKLLSQKRKIRIEKYKLAKKLLKN